MFWRGAKKAVIQQKKAYHSHWQHHHLLHHDNRCCCMLQVLLLLLLLLLPPFLPLLLLMPLCCYSCCCHYHDRGDDCCYFYGDDDCASCYSDYHGVLCGPTKRRPTRLAVWKPLWAQGFAAPPNDVRCGNPLSTEGFEEPGSHPQSAVWEPCCHSDSQHHCQNSCDVCDTCESLRMLVNACGRFRNTNAWILDSAPPQDARPLGTLLQAFGNKCFQCLCSNHGSASMRPRAP